MRNTIIALIWVILFIFLGIFVDNKVEAFGINYIKDVEATYEVVHDENWKYADEMLDDLFEKLETQKDFWLKVLDHQYYDDINLELNLVRNAIYCKNKIRALEGLEKLKSTLTNIIDDEKCNLNYIF
ncbi:DUF4363 family protein [Intestinibacter sp.]